MYLRFVYSTPVDGMGAREGVFQAAGMLAEHPMTDEAISARINEIMDWFADNLPEPDRFTRTSSKGYFRRDWKGLSWFKPSATEHIARAFELASILSDNGYPVELLKTDRVGYVVFEDDYQIVAEPFAETRT